MIEIQTPGFLSTMLYLTPLNPVIFPEFASKDDTNHAEEGELLIVPNRDFLQKNYGSLDNNSFVGTESLKKSTLAMIREGNGRDLLEGYLVSPYFLQEGYGLTETLQFAIGLSSLLHTVKEQSKIVRLIQTEHGHAVVPFQDHPQQIDDAVAVVKY